MAGLADIAGRVVGCTPIDVLCSFLASVAHQVKPFGAYAAHEGRGFDGRVDIVGQTIGDRGESHAHLLVELGPVGCQHIS